MNRIWWIEWDVSYKHISMIYLEPEIFLILKGVPSKNGGGEEEEKKKRRNVVYFLTSGGREDTGSSKACFVIFIDPNTAFIQSEKKFKTVDASSEHQMWNFSEGKIKEVFQWKFIVLTSKEQLQSQKKRRKIKISVPCNVKYRYLLFASAEIIEWNRTQSEECSYDNVSFTIAFTLEAQNYQPHWNHCRGRSQIKPETSRWDASCKLLKCLE